MTRRPSQPRPMPAPYRAAVVVAVTLGVIATLLGIGSLATVLTRGTDTGQADATACRTVPWNALPDAATLPTGWTIASTRFLLDIMTTTVVGPAPSGSTQGLAAFVSVACFGGDAQLVLAHDHDAALRGGAQDVSLPKLGDDSIAVSSAMTSSTTIYIRRGILVADVTGANSLDQSVLQSIAGEVDQAMVRALAASPAPGSTAPTPASAGATAAPIASASGAITTASPAPATPAPVSHVAPDLEALLPQTIGGSTMTKQSVTGTSALGTDATSQALLASLSQYGKTSGDLQIAEAHDPAGTAKVQLFAFRVSGLSGSQLAAAIVGSWMANTTQTPTQSKATIGGHPVTKVSYAQGATDYVYATDTVAFDIETSDASLAATVLPLLK